MTTHTTEYRSLRRFVGNPRAVKRLDRVAQAAWNRPDRCCADFPFALIGPASTGKTSLAKAFAEAVQLPFVEIQPHAVSKIDDVYELIRTEIESKAVWNHVTNELESAWIETGFDGKSYLPACIVFIDEVHNLNRPVVQGLLKAVENSDRTMVTEKGLEVDTSKVCWCIATTDRGELFDAFDTRFSKISLSLYSAHEIAQIIKYNHPSLPDAACFEVAKYAGNVPREALAFAREMILEREASGAEWTDCASVVAEDNAIDKFGMTYQRVKILQALGKHPIPADRLSHIAGVKPLELRKFVLPPLLSCQTPLVTVCNKGFVITPAGLKELDKRMIRYNAQEAIPAAVRPMFKE